MTVMKAIPGRLPPDHILIFLLQISPTVFSMPLDNITRQEKASEDDFIDEKASLPYPDADFPLPEVSLYSQFAGKLRGATAMLRNHTLLFPYAFPSKRSPARHVDIGITDQIDWPEDLQARPPPTTQNGALVRRRTPRIRQPRPLSQRSPQPRCLLACLQTFAVCNLESRPIPTQATMSWTN